MFYIHFASVYNRPRLAFGLSSGELTSPLVIRKGAPVELVSLSANVRFAVSNSIAFNSLALSAKKSSISLMCLSMKVVSPRRSITCCRVRSIRASFCLMAALVLASSSGIGSIRSSGSGGSRLMVSSSDNSILATCKSVKITTILLVRYCMKEEAHTNN